MFENTGHIWISSKDTLIWAIFNTGDRVHHKQESNRKWGGPGTVIGQGHKQVFVRHSSELVRVHSSRLIHVDNAASFR